ncbi:hypothetical protein ACULLB_09705 [Enterococcus gallinarum]|uniref:hypothetical protein n=1 Tax=Enterococcus gallinarum TaxID=1353 RepID=UPI0020908ADC|nr:hypothetical protein [Enterococcus gallinarum]MCO5478569.1 hypothetical protein [Enterococcus gallinarum]
MEHHTHENHTHQHSLGCGHTKILHKDHVDYVHNGHLHHAHEDHWDECTLEVNEKNPDSCNHVEAICQHTPDCGHEQVPHGDHTDYLVNGRLQHVHDDHIDDHGTVEVL